MLGESLKQLPPKSQSAMRDPAFDPPQEPYEAPPRDPNATPSMAQYIEIKAANPDCLLFYRMGDFYELFFRDAEIASRTLGIVLTKRGKHAGEDIPMCGVPVTRSDEYLHRLIAAGHRVAICEQLEDPAEARKRGSKAVVRRDVVRIVTPGTITEDGLLDARRASLLTAIARQKTGEEQWDYALAAVDLSTGELVVGRVGEADLAGEISRLDPAKCSCPMRCWRRKTSEFSGIIPVLPSPVRRGTGSIRLPPSAAARLFRCRHAGCLWRLLAAGSGGTRRAHRLSRPHATGPARAADGAAPSRFRRDHGD